MSRRDEFGNAHRVLGRADLAAGRGGVVDGDWSVAPEFGGWHYEFYGYLSFAHEAGAQAGYTAEQLFFGVDVLDADDLLDVYLGGEQDQRTVGIDDDGVGLFLDGVFLGVLEAYQNRNAHVHALAATAILRRQFVWMDGHLTTVASMWWVLNG
jgi:hypothetical protein